MELAYTHLPTAASCSIMARVAQRAYMKWCYDAHHHRRYYQALLGIREMDQQLLQT